MSKNVKRIGLYFNLDNPIENKMWQYLESKRNKSSAIKDLLEKVTSNIEIDLEINNKSEKTTINEDECSLTKEDLTAAGDGIIGF